MLASEACPICRNRIEGKPSPKILLAGMVRGRRLADAAAPRWSFECGDCQQQWLAEPVSPSLLMARY